MKRMMIACGLAGTALILMAAYALVTSRIDQNHLPRGFEPNDPLPFKQIESNSDQRAVLMWRVDNVSDHPKRGEASFKCRTIVLAKGEEDTNWYLSELTSSLVDGKWTPFMEPLESQESRKPGEPKIAPHEETFDHRPNNEEILNFLRESRFFASNDIVDCSVNESGWESVVGTPPPTRFPSNLRVKCIRNTFLTDYFDLSPTRPPGKFGEPSDDEQ